MSPNMDDNSPFAKFRKEPPPRTAAPPPAADARVEPLENALRDLKAEFDAYKARAVPPPPPQKADPELLRRLERAEAVIEELRGKLAASEEEAAARAGTAASKDGLKNLDLRVTDLSSAFDGLTRSLSRERELAARLELSESSLAELKAAFSAQQSQVKRSLEALAPREALEALSVSVAAALSGLEDLKRRETEAAGEFSRIEHECHKTLGEMRGYAKSAEERPLAARFEDHFRESVGRLNAKLADAETSMYAALAELSGRLNSDRALYTKIFEEAEDRVRKGVEPEIKAAEGQLKWLRDSVDWLMTEYKVVMERKVRSLEAKYSAFEALSTRMDTISGALEKRER